jgi:hypothetical protein
MRNSIVKYQVVVAMALSAVVSFLACVEPSFAGLPSAGINAGASSEGGGNVLPAVAQPKGYSLSRMARMFAPFNVTDHSGVPPRTPFQALYTSATNSNTFVVSPGTMLYVPILYNDESPPPIGQIPDVTDRQALLDYFYSQQHFGTVYTIITVDGQDTALGPDYLVGLYFSPPLPDTAQSYMTVAAFLTPLKKGTHTVGISGLATGADIVAVVGGPWQFSLVYTVIVR